MLAFEIFDIQFPYLTNGGLYWAKILAERKHESVLFHVFPKNLIDFCSFDLIMSNDGTFQTSSQYPIQKEFYASICMALYTHLSAGVLNRIE